MKKIILAMITLLTIILSTPLITQASPLVYPTERIYGQDRIDTAIKISQKGWSSAQTIILCEYSDYPDSIASTPYAVSLDAPILLTKGDSIDPRVVKELQRLKPQNVILLGGIACLQPPIEMELDKLSLKWERVGGIDRYETSILLAKRIKSDSVIIANGDNFPDALSAATFAGIKQIPIVLTSTTLPHSDLQYLIETGPKHIIVIGGEVVVPSAELTQNNFTIETRLGGLDRYETNAKVTSFMKEAYKSNDIFLASGLTFPDAIAGTVLASKTNSPLLLTEKEDIPPSVYTLMREHMKIEPPSKSSDISVNQEPKKGNITATGGLNLRDTPSSTGKTLLTIPKGTTIDLIDHQGQWYKTTYQAKTGWISDAYVTVTSANSTSTDVSDPKTSSNDLSNKPQKGEITAIGGLNLRDTPSSTGKTLLTIPKGTTIDLIDHQGQWYKTIYQAKTGWISDAYVVPICAIKTTSNTFNSTKTISVDSPTTIDLSVNGIVYILGGTGIISSKTQTIIEGKDSSKYPDNLKDFPPLPSEIKQLEPPSRGDDVITPPPSDNFPIVKNYDPSKEILLDPFQGIPVNALSDKTIILDPGHGGPDTGAIGPNHTYEKDNNLAIALALNTILQQAGAKVILTRNQDISPATNYSEKDDLQARVDLANKNKADLFICIHNDSFINPDIQGTSTYYSQDNPKQSESLQLANSIQSAVIDTLKTNNRGLKEAGFYVLRQTTMPAILLETAFISNPYEEARLQNPIFRKNVAAAIFHGIYNYYKNPLPKD